MANLFSYYDPEDRERYERQFEQDCEQNHDQLRHYRISDKWNKLHELANKGFQEANKRNRGKRWPILSGRKKTDISKDLPQAVCILFAFADYYQQLEDVCIIYNKPWISPEMRVEFEDVISELREDVTYSFGPQDEVDIFTKCMVEVKKYIGTDIKKTARKKTVWKEPKYKPLIEEALRVVESDINDRNQNEQKGRDGQGKSKKITKGELSKPIQPDEAQALSDEAKAAILIIADDTDSLAEYIKNVGKSQSTLDKVDKLRKRIVEDSARYGLAYIPRESCNPIAIVLHDLLLTIVKQILPYYKSIRKTPKPKENAEKLQYVAGQLRRLAGEQSGAETGLSGGDAQGFKFDGYKQAMYNGRDLDISSGRAVKILKLLYDSMPNIVTHEQVNEAAEQPKSRTSEEMTRAYIVSIRKALKKNKIPYTVPPAKRGGGYCLKAVYYSANSKRRKAK